MLPNYGRHLLPTNLGSPNAFACTLYGDREERVDCGTCTAKCPYSGLTRNSWCILYTPLMCRKCMTECAMHMEDEYEPR